MAKKDYIDRMISESSKLHERFEKLLVFMEGPSFNELSEVDRDLISAQLGAMRAYETLLVHRLARATGCIL